MEGHAMLCQFSVKNYKSIRDEITFDMQAAAISAVASLVLILVLIKKCVTVTVIRWNLIYS